MAQPDLVSTFEINLEDGTSKVAESAATALKKLQGAIEKDLSALKSMQAAMRNLKGATTPNLTLIAQLKAKIDAQKDSIATAQSSFIKLGGSLAGVRKAGKPTGSAFAELGQQAQAVGGPIGGLVSKFENLKGLLARGALALGVVAIAAALAALAVAAVAATAALLKYGIAQANARRSELLRIEGLTKMRNWFGLAAGNAQQMQTQIDKVAAGSAAGRDKIAEYSTELYKMGLRGENLNQTLEAMAIKSVAQGDAAAHAFAGWAAGAALSGRSVKRLADDVKARLGGVAARAMLDLDVQAQKMHESFSALFAGLKIEAMVKAFATLSQLFSQNTRSGQALKALVTGLLQPLINAITYVAPLAKRFFQGLIIGALLVGIAFYTVRNAFRKAFGESDLLKNLDLATVALKVGVVAAFMLAGALGLLTLMAGAIAAPFVIAGAAFSAVIGIVGGVYDYLSNLDWSAAGSAMLDGITSGLTGGADKLMAAVKGLGASTLDAFKGALGIASPSKAFARAGAELPAGVEAGIEEGTPAAQRAASKIVAIPSIPAGVDKSEGARASKSGGDRPVSFTFGDIVLNGVSDKPAEIVADIKRELQTMLEVVAIELGCSPRGA